MKIFSFFHRTIPVGSNQNSRSLSLIFSVLIFLLSFVVVCVFLFSQGFHSWGNSNLYKITVEIPVNIQNQSPQYQTQKIQNVIEELRKTKGILNIHTVDPEKLRSLLKVWTGDSQPNAYFPIPTLLDVSIDPHQGLDLDIIKQQLRKISSDISLEDHNTWSQKLLIFSKSLRLITFVIGTFILLCIAVIVILVTKSTLQAYYSTLDILRLLGAKDSYIARIFQNQILKSSFWGGIWGIVFSIPTTYAFLIILKYLGLEGMTWNMALWHIIILIIMVPFAVAFIGALVSRITVLVHLKALDTQ